MRIILIMLPMKELVLFSEIENANRFLDMYNKIFRQNYEKTGNQTFSTLTAVVSCDFEEFSSLMLEFYKEGFQFGSLY